MKYLFCSRFKKGFLGSNETIVISGSSKIYEVPLLNIPLSIKCYEIIRF